MRPSASPATAALAFTIDLRKAITTAAEDHLSHEEKSSYVDGKADTVLREIIEGHIALCSMCANEIRELRAFRAMLSTYPQEVLAPAVPPSIWTRSLEWLHRPAERILLRLAPTIGVALLFLVFWRPKASPVQSGNSLATELTNLKQELSKIAKERDQSNTLASEQSQRAKRAEERSIELASQRDALARKTAEYQQMVTRNTELLARNKKADASHQDVHSENTKEALTKLETGVFRAKDGQLLFHTARPVRPSDQALMLAALTVSKLKFPADKLNRVETGSSVVLGPNVPKPKGKPLQQLRPNATRLLSSRPTFIWEDIPEANRYRLRVNTTSGSAIAQVTVQKSGPDWSITVTEPDAGKEHTPYTARIGTRWTVPDGWELFAPGTVYVWSVEAYSRSPQDASPVAMSRQVAKFELVDGQERRMAEEARDYYFGAPLLLGSYYASLGLLDEAQDQFTSQLQRDSKSIEAKRLLNVLQMQKTSPSREK